MPPVSSLRRPVHDYPSQLLPAVVPEQHPVLRFPLQEGLRINQRSRVCRAAMQAAMCHGSMVESGAQSFLLFLDERSLPVDEACGAVNAAVEQLLADFRREDAEWAEWLSLHPDLRACYTGGL